MYFDRRVSGLEMMLGSCPACTKKQHVVIIDEDDPDHFPDSGPEHCERCGRELETIIINLVSEHSPTCCS